MQFFQTYASHIQTESLMTAVAHNIAVSGIDPETFLTEFIKENYPILEADVILAFNDIVLLEAGENPFPQHGGFWGGVKNVAGGAWDALKRGAGTVQQAFQQAQNSNIEHAFSDAWKYVNALVQAVQKDPRMQNWEGSQGLHRMLSDMQQKLGQYGQQLQMHLNGEQEQPVQAQQVQPQPPQEQPVQAQKVEPAQPVQAQQVEPAQAPKRFVPKPINRFKKQPTPAVAPTEFPSYAAYGAEGSPTWESARH